MRRHAKTWRRFMDLPAVHAMTWGPSSLSEDSDRAALALSPP